MKVLHIISGGDKGGAKTHVFALLSALIKNIDIMVICFMKGVFYEEIQELPIPSILIEQKFRYDLTVVKKLIKHIRENRYDLIHVHGARANFISTFLRKYIGIPIITTIHSDYKLDFTDNLYKKIFFTEINAASLRFMDYYIAVSDNFKKMLVKRGFQEEDIYTVYNAIDFNENIKFKSKEEFLKEHNILDDGKIIIGIIGRFDKVKGHEVFIRACAEVYSKNKNVLFLLAGEGDEKENLEKLADSLGIKEQVKFLGFIKDIYSFINTIDINVLSSHSESFPYVLLEGSYMSKATVCTAVGGIPDLIKNNETGFLAEVNNHEQLGEQILKFVNDKNKRIELGTNLNKFAKENFSSESLKNRHLEIYKSVLKREKENNNLFDIVLSGYYGFNNSGDEAMLESIINSLREEKEDVKILVLSKKPEETSEKYNVFSLNRYDFLKIPKYLKKSRVFINGGGSLIQDVTSTHSLVYYTLLMHMAKRYGLHLMLYANGIGPIIKKSNRKRAVKALRICDKITLREPDSFDELKKLGLENLNVSLSADPTLDTKKATNKEVKEIFEKENIDWNENYFGISYRMWRYNDTEYAEKLGRVIDYIYNTYKLKPIFIPMHYPNDQVVGARIIEHAKTECFMLKNEYSVRELMGIIEKTEFIISMRLHTLIYAFSVNVPPIGLVYDPKIKSFLEYANQNRYLGIENINEKLLIQYVDEVQNNKEKIKKELSLELEKLKVLIKEDPKTAIALIK